MLLGPCETKGFAREKERIDVPCTTNIHKRNVISTDAACHYQTSPESICLSN